jgi:PAS domain S-box-containing protein
MGANVLDRFNRHHRLLATGLVAPLVASLILLPLRNSLTSAALLMVLVVVGVASTGDRLAGWLTALSAGLWFDLILTPKHATDTDVQTTLVLLAVGVAVTEIAHRGAEAAKHANRMAAVVEHSGDAIIGRGLDDAITSWNPAAERILGYSSQEIIGKPAGVLISKDRADEVKADGTKVRAGKSVEHLETTRVRKDGTVIPVSLTVSPIRDADGTIVGASTIARDMTERRKAFEAARSMIESSLDSLVAISPEGKITDANQATVKLTGVPREQLIGTSFSDYFTDPKKADEIYQRVFTEGVAVDYPLTLHHRNNGHETLTEVLFNASAYRDTAGNVLGVFAAARDVTEQMQAQREVVERLDELEQFQRLTVGRELKMIELKEEIEYLKKSSHPERDESNDQG